MLYNCGMIVFILSFFVGYILSFGLVRLRTIRLSARAGAHIECRCSSSCAKDVTITNVIIKPPHRKWDWGVNDVMPGSEGLGILVIFEKELVEIRLCARPVELWSTGCTARLFGQWVEIGLDSSAGELTDGRCRNSQHSNNSVSLSPRVENLKVKQVIKVSYLNYRESSVFRDSYTWEHFTEPHSGDDINSICVKKRREKRTRQHWRQRGYMNTRTWRLH